MPKNLESIGMDHCNGFPTPDKVEALLGTDENSPEDKIDQTNSYASIIGMIFYLQSNERPAVSFAIHQCDQFTHNTKESYETAVRRICRYLQGTKENGLVFNPYKNWWWIIMLMQILRDCGDMKILKTLFVLEVELDSW